MVHIHGQDAERALGIRVGEILMQVNALSPWGTYFLVRVARLMHSVMAKLPMDSVYWLVYCLFALLAVVTVVSCSCLPTQVRVAACHKSFTTTECIEEALQPYLLVLRTFKLRRAMCDSSPLEFVYTWWYLCLSPPTVRLSSGNTEECTRCSWFDPKFPDQISLNLRLVKHSMRAKVENKLYYSFLFFTFLLRETVHYLCYNTTHEKNGKVKSTKRDQGETSYLIEETIFGGAWLPLIAPTVDKKEIVGICYFVPSLPGKTLHPRTVSVIDEYLEDMLWGNETLRPPNEAEIKQIPDNYIVAEPWKLVKPKRCVIGPCVPPHIDRRYSY